jgi:hypothetical protein
MRIRVDGEWRVGTALDLREDGVAATELAERIRDLDADEVVCPPPGTVHDHVGVVRAGMAFDLRDAAVAAGRSLGLCPPQAEAIEALDRQIAAISPPEPDLRAARKRAAEASEAVEALRERVARVSGRLSEARDAGRATDELEAELNETTRELSEAETEAAAARQALEAAERRAAREERAERLSLRDQRENRRRDARSWLVEQMEPALERAIASLPVDGVAFEGVCEFAGPARVAALAVVRVARLAAPVILADSPFETAVRARAALDAPVVLV